MMKHSALLFGLCAALLTAAAPAHAQEASAPAELLPSPAPAPAHTRDLQSDT